MPPAAPLPSASRAETAGAGTGEDPGDTGEPPADADRSRRPRLRTRVQAFAGLLDRKPPSPRTKRILLVVAMGVFLGISIPSFGTLQDGRAFRPWILPLLILVTTPLTVAANAAEYRVMGSIGGHRISWRDSVSLTILAAAANLLPLPGGVVVRTQALRKKGSSYRRALAANLAAGLAWIAAGGIGMGALLIWQPERRLLAVALLAGSVVTLGGLWALLHRADPDRATHHLRRLITVEAGVVATSSLRLWLAFALIGFNARPAQAVVMSGSVIVAALVGIFPAGLGLREALAGLIAVVVDMPPNRAIAATAADRVAAQIGLALLAGVVAIVHRGQPAVDDEALDDPLLHTIDLP